DEFFFRHEKCACKASDSFRPLRMPTRSLNRCAWNTVGSHQNQSPRYNIRMNLTNRTPMLIDQCHVHELLSHVVQGVTTDRTSQEDLNAGGTASLVAANPE